MTNASRPMTRFEFEPVQSSNSIPNVPTLSFRRSRETCNLNGISPVAQRFPGIETGQIGSCLNKYWCHQSHMRKVRLTEPSQIQNWSEAKGINPEEHFSGGTRTKNRHKHEFCFGYSQRLENWHESPQLTLQWGTLPQNGAIDWTEPRFPIKDRNYLWKILLCSNTCRKKFSINIAPLIQSRARS